MRLASYKGEWHDRRMSPRRAAIEMLHAVLVERCALDEVSPIRTASLSENDGRFALMLTLTTLRHLGQVDALLTTYLDKPLPEKRAHVLHALRIGVVQLLWLQTPAHAAVHETVEAIKKGKDAGLSGLVNAVLQRIAREKPAIPDAGHNLPSWLRARWENFYGVEPVAAIIRVASARPPLDLHLPAPTTLSIGTRLDDSIWRLPSDHPPITELEGFKDGAFWVQDIAASYPVRLLGDVRGKTVLDIGAAPGGKTAQLARAGAHVTALDRSAPRMELLRENMARLGCAVTPIVADVNEWQSEQLYEAIILDAPCSATGTWRKHPEVVHTIEPTDIFELMKLQRTMLRRAWGWLQPGGAMVYCVCSLEREEGESQVDWFLGTFGDARLGAQQAAAIPAECFVPSGLRTVPCHLEEKGGMGGFFATVFVKHS